MGFCEFLADLLAAGVTPYDCMVVWLSLGVPAYDCLSLVRDAKSKYLRHIELLILCLNCLKSLLYGLLNIIEDLLRIVF